MQSTITGQFATRREAELAVERLVQELGIERSSVSVAPRGVANSAGTRVAGADAESGHPGVEKHGDPELNDLIEVSVGCSEAEAGKIETTMKSVGARQVAGR
ncbi:hypothetical protein BJ123_110149 [Rhodopseudomonas thermotolerans]|uniref:Uncharacterized protein n=2 Tax=Rhodopseudomonas TaxID=1073 RepID=A0A336JSV2_9BRAD|nr:MULTISPECIES: hypothetical protein [Rhodopseudomonas]RED34510.1 hypothetical protein BJ125_110149 [Rhodopseudomonas pentothenatexigens]REG02706.1 hypothetical protein BJ123_110149 [Rhodopseudomonas thermotolerans]SSW91179.1 hypothetical protein SAMN05892882_110149 [Rhodopseudomonas pentothenatexigens]